MKEIVLMLELAAENDWIDAFYLPFGQNVGFKPVMGSCTQALTCLMNIRISSGVDILLISGRVLVKKKILKQIGF